jgi:hypothetical protein
MDSKILETLGLDTAQLQELLVARLVDALLHDAKWEQWDNEDGEPTDAEMKASVPCNVTRGLKSLVADAISTEMARLCDAYVVPMVREEIASATIRRTNQYGEARTEPMTFREYAALCSREYLQERVDRDGKACNSYNSDGKPTRLMWIVDVTLRAQITQHIAEAVKDANGELAASITAAVKQTLASICNVHVETTLGR